MSQLSRLSSVVFSVLICFASALQAQEPSKDVLGALRYRHIGPVGNRVTSVAGVVGQPNIYYVGAASGGIFKTTDGGTHWEPIFDGQPVSSIGSLAVAPSDAGIVWAGTGEAHIRSHISVGAGIYKSTDAGKTWKLMGLEKTGRIGRIVIDPRILTWCWWRRWAQLWAATGARVFSHDRRRQNLGPRFVRRRKHRRVGNSDGRATRAFCSPHVAARHTHVGARKWWTGSGIYKSTDGGAPGKNYRPRFASSHYWKVALAIAN